MVSRVSDAIAQRVQTTRNLSQLAQIVVNVFFFETACAELENLLVALRASHRGGAVQLSAVESFRGTLEATHSRIVKTIGLKLDDCFELAEYDWTTTRSSPKMDDEQPSIYLTEMADYLNTVMHSVLVQVPPVVLNAIYRGALEHIADTMMVCYPCLAKSWYFTTNVAN